MNQLEVQTHLGKCDPERQYCVVRLLHETEIGDRSVPSYEMVVPDLTKEEAEQYVEDQQ